MPTEPARPPCPIRRVPLTLAAVPATASSPARAGRTVEIEIQWHREDRRDRPLVVFLHEGLGSVAMWRGFPAALCAAADLRGLVYSRPGYGRSTPRAAGERWPAHYLHVEAGIVLPALLAALDVAEPPWLLGHSDGGSIALIRAADRPEAVAGCIVVAPHLMVEESGLATIRAVREAYRSTGLRTRLARYHGDVDSAFYGWNDVWLSAAFRSWSIEERIAAIRCPVLAIQGDRDEYGSLAHVDGIAARVPGAEVLVLPGCGHAPHREAPDPVITAITGFVTARRAGPSRP